MTGIQKCALPIWICNVSFTPLNGYKGQGLRGIADGMAGMWRQLDAREARVARRNLELIRPELDAAAREALLVNICLLYTSRCV